VLLDTEKLYQDAIQELTIEKKKRQDSESKMEADK
jgi:hypothetical protein